MNSKKASLRRSFFEEAIQKDRMGFIAVIKKVWPLLKCYRMRIGLLLAVVISYVVIGRVLPVIFGYAIDSGIKQKSLPAIYHAAILYFVLEVLRTLFRFTQNYGFQKLGNRALFLLRERLIKHVQSLPLNYFDKNPAGRTVSRITNDIAAIGELFGPGFTTIFISSIEIIGILIGMTLVSPKLTLVVILLAPPLSYFCMHLSRKIRGVFQEAKQKLATINAFTAESLSGLKIIQLFHKSRDRQEEFDRYSAEYLHLNLKTVGLFALLWPVLEFFNMATMISAIFIGGLYREELGLSLGQLTTYLLMAQSFFQPLRIILERYTQFQNSLASADRIFALLEEPMESQEGQLLTESGITGPIRFQNISHRYDPSGPWALKNINIELFPGESLALVGRTGSGKTTLISLLQQLYLPTEGNILINDRPLSCISLKSWREKVGVVLQDNFIFKGTIASNISFNNPKITRDRIEWAAAHSGCHRLLINHPEGLDAQVEERGANLSVGEKQLIAFARVLAFDPEVFILDEATSNIDSISEDLIQKATIEVISKRTSVIIAHRLSTVLGCDRIALLDKGELLEIGTHQELMDKKGAYFELYGAIENSRRFWSLPGSQQSDC